MGYMDLKLSIQYQNHWRIRHKRIRKLIRVPADATDQVQQEEENSPHSCSPSSSETQTTMTPMDLDLYRATIKGDVDNFIDVLVRISTEKRLSPHAVLEQVTPLGNTFLHVAANFGHDNLVGFIAYHLPSLLTGRNSKGDTALHVAARGGHLQSASVITRFGEDSPGCSSSAASTELEGRADLLLRMKNKEGNTALHEAVMNNHEDMFYRLIRNEPKAICDINDKGKSPLYIATEAGNVHLVESMLSYFVEEEYSCENLQGKSPVHAAIKARNIDLLKIILNKVSAFMYLRDEGGGTPLHYSASIDYFEGIQYLLDMYSEGVLVRDGNGFLPIHNASRKGHLDIVQELLHYCPDWRELLTEQGENILHIAAKSGRNNVVNYILNTPELQILVNETDEDGNTPLHLATMSWHPKVVSALTWDNGINLNLVNNEGLRPLDVAEEPIEMAASFRKRLTWVALKSAGAERSKFPTINRVNAQSSSDYQPPKMETFKDRVNTLLLVATLVATVTFAAGFTMPGGYNNSDPDQGMATMLRRPNFQVFVICDTVAMYSSIIVAVSLIWAQLGDLNLVLTSLKLALPLLGIALAMMSMAFMAGVHLVVSKLDWLANLIFIMGIVFLATLLALFVPLFFPNTSSHRVLRYFSYYNFYLMMVASKSYPEDEEE